MHDTITGPRTVGLHTAIMAAIGQVPAQVKAHALAQVTAYTEQVNRAAADANSTTPMRTSSGPRSGHAPPAKTEPVRPKSTPHGSQATTR
ncbi:hypothetical protein HQO84_24465 [Rhodococcus fascians]|uniref:hypothetical protein n=1 Tax=Nocardiaceae TaxID=85025 RepID=UPI000651C76F|nr:MULTISPECIES: hypothetical protein [Rhodococcus]KMJ47443.1 hypothetical protein ACG96_23325 [Rhodococcus fascians]MBX5333367.1 hypothetical protein [Rhodococcus fascians]MBY3989257.1 hypothetical protein [Rhodococcus fascians]MBY3999000.1 hypothetical protein [Rhodococcus fascians]MBY4004804.1 hypothetical protein [Rhodococcus fascians]